MILNQDSGASKVEAEVKVKILHKSAIAYQLNGLAFFTLHLLLLTLSPLNGYRFENYFQDLVCKCA